MTFVQVHNWTLDRQYFRNKLNRVLGDILGKLQLSPVQEMGTLFP